MKPFVIVLSVVFVLFGLGFFKSRRQTEESQRPTSNLQRTHFDKNSPDISVLMSRIANQRGALALVTEDIPEGQELLALFEKQAHPLLFQDNRAYQLSVRPSTDEFFYVTVVSDDQFRLILGEQGNSFAEGFAAEIRTLFLNAQPMTKCWQGFLLAHEMVHVWDSVIDRRPTVPFLSDANVIEEIRAYEFEFKVIDHWTKGKFGNMVEQIAKENGPLTPSGRLLEKFDSLFPAAFDQNEDGIRRDVYYLAASFRKAELQNKNVLQEKMRQYRTLIQPSAD